MSKAKKYDRSYKEQSVKLELKVGVSEELNLPYGTLYGLVQEAKNGELNIEERTYENAMSLVEEICQLRSEPMETGRKKGKVLYITVTGNKYNRYEFIHKWLASDTYDETVNFYGHLCSHTKA